MGERDCDRSNSPGCDDQLFDFPYAPTFQPSAEEFRDPTSYISKIRPQAELFGVCKIKPPADWSPPFVADPEKFRFTPRTQHVTGKQDRECPNCCELKPKVAQLFCCLCYDMYHESCLEPGDTEKEDGLWWCPSCVRGMGHCLQDALLSDQRYSLSQFGDMADKFKAEYFNAPPSLITARAVEHDFWRLKSASDEEVTVEFGDNLSSEEYGSGFPVAHCRSDPPEIREFHRSPWNLHNLARLESSVLLHVQEAQLHTPTVDVGMCFTSHGWIQAPHWLYSVSYLHWGEPRTWYVVPGQAAKAFEDLVHSQTPPIPSSVTPEKLWEAGLPVFRLEQNATDFIIIFPRSYQLNFSHGYNFAESVSYAPPDWIAFGRECEAYYSSKRRPSLFSHAEVLCRMACSWPCLDPALRPAVYDDLKRLLNENRARFKRAVRQGVTSSSKEMMEAMPWRERRCIFCHSICFLSAVTCVCNADRMVCIDHLDFLCDCDFSSYTLRYRYADEEIPRLLSNLSSWVEELSAWKEKVAEVFANLSDKNDLNTFKNLLSEAEESQFPESELLLCLRNTVKEATQLAELCSQLSNRKVRTRTHSTTTDSKVKLSLDELSSLCGAVGDLPCRMPEGDAVMSLLKRTENCRRVALELLAQDLPDSAELEECSEQASGLDIHFPEISVLKQRIIQVEWLDEVNSLREAPEQVTMYALRRLISIGIELPPHTRVEQALVELQVLLRSVEDWQEKAKICLDVKCRQNINVLESLLEEAKNIPAFLPNIQALHNVLKKGKEWIAKVEAMQRSDEYPYLDILEKLVNAGRGIPLDLDQLPVLEQQAMSAKAWRDRTSRTFLRKNSLYTLMQALAPRTVVGVESLHTSKTLQQMQYQQLYQSTDVHSVDSATVVQVFKKAEIQEMMSMRELRAQNIQKRLREPQNAVYCVCRRGFHGFMLQCELCKDSFHASCVPLPKTTGSKARLLTQAQQIAAAASREVKFLCPCCLRSRRPRLETILSLLVTMHKVPVRLPEGDALKCLTERAMNWQDRARQTLSTEELSSALAKLSVLSQKLVEAAAREKTEKIISNELKKAASKPELGINMMAIRTSHSSSVEKPSYEDEHTTSFSNSEHAYSSVSKNMQGSSSTGGPPVNKSKMNMNAPLLSLSESVRAQLEELMMEGDLLEVSLDETQHIWRILQATKPPQNFKYPDVDDIEHELMACQVQRERLMHEHKKERKRKHSELDGMGMHYPAPQRKPRLSFSKEFDKIRRPRIKGMKRGMRKEMGQVRGPRKQADGRNFQSRKGKRGTSDDDGDECSARPCLHPLEREVDWVQCDGGCELWFHLFCVGLDKRDVKEDEDFICRVCQASGAS